MSAVSFLRQFHERVDSLYSAFMHVVLGPM
jgi:hypothetical protein